MGKRTSSRVVNFLAGLRVMISAGGTGYRLSRVAERLSIFRETFAPPLIVLPDISSWKKHGEAALDERDGVAIISAKSSEDGVMIPFAAVGTEVYSVRVEYRSPSLVAIEIWNVDEQLRKVGDISQHSFWTKPVEYYRQQLI